MPKIEETLAWASTKAAKRELYPRKNVYFAGEHLDEVYDYCVWRTHVAGYTMVGDYRATAVSSMLKDLVIRDYLKSMLDQEDRERFEAWRRDQYIRSGLNATDAALHLRELLNARYEKGQTRHRTGLKRMAERIEKQ